MIQVRALKTFSHSPHVGRLEEGQIKSIDSQQAKILADDGLVELLGDDDGQATPKPNVRPWISFDRPASVKVGDVLHKEKAPEQKAEPETEKKAEQAEVKKKKYERKIQ